MRSVVVPLLRLPFALVSHIPQVVSLLPCHGLRIMSGDLRRPPLAEIIIRRVSHHRRLVLVVGMVALAAVIAVIDVVTQQLSPAYSTAFR